MGRLVRLTDPNHASYQFGYDPVGRLLETVAFDGMVTTYGYDEESGQLATIDEAGKVTEIEFDRGGRLARRVCGEAGERFAYDASGRLIDAWNSVSRVQQFFDPVGNLVRGHHAYNEIRTRIGNVRSDGHRVD